MDFVSRIILGLILLLGGLGYAALRLLADMDGDPDQGPLAGWGPLIAALGIAVLGVIAGGDYFVQRYRFLKRHRMSKQEIKEEFRQTEGDPAVKAKIKQIRTERARRRMMAPAGFWLQPVSLRPVRNRTR